jgi:hypothetical protein
MSTGSDGDGDGDRYSFLDYTDKPILQNFSCLSYLKIADTKYVQILNYFLKNPGKTTQEVVDEASSLEELKNYDYNTIRRYVNYLLDDLKLIEIEKKELVQNMKSKYKKYYRLSLNGIFFVILNTFDNSKEDLIFSLLRNYGNNILFSLFLYPFIKEQTLKALRVGWDSDIFFNISLYLRDVCKDIVESIRSLRTMNFTTTDGYIIKQVFICSTNTDSSLQTSSTLVLQHFLNKILKWDWVFKSTVIPKIDENVIEISDPYNPKNNSRITLLNDEKKAVLRQNSTKLYEFSITVNDSSLILGAKTKIKRIDSLSLSFVNRCREHLLIFLTKTREKSPYNVTFDILNQDENLKKALEHMDLKPMVKDDFL